MLPMIAATPAGHDENAIAVRQVEELIGLELAFEANGIESQITNVTQLVLDTLVIDAQEHVGRPTPAPDQNIAMVNVKQFVSFGSFFCGDLAYAELCAGRLRGRVSNAEPHAHGPKVLRTQRIRPPQLRILHSQLRILVGREGDALVLVRAERQPLLEPSDALHRRFERS